MQENFKFLKDQDYSILFAKHIKWSEVEDIPQINRNSKLVQLLLSEETQRLEFLWVDNPTSQENTINELYSILKQDEYNKLLVISSMYKIIENNKQKNNYINTHKNSSYYVELNSINSIQYLENLLVTLKTIYDIKKVIITDFSFIKQLKISTSNIFDYLIDLSEIFKLKFIVIIDQKTYNTIKSIGNELFLE